MYIPGDHFEMLMQENLRGHNFVLFADLRSGSGHRRRRCASIEPAPGRRAVSPSTLQTPGRFVPPAF